MNMMYVDFCMFIQMSMWLNGMHIVSRMWFWVLKRTVASSQEGIFVLRKSWEQEN